MRPAGLVHLDVGELCALAGGDPWQLDDELQAGDAGAINNLADAFHRSGNHVKEADDDFNTAKQKFREGYQRNGSEHPINESAEVTRATAALNGHREQLSQIAVKLEQVAATLAQAQRDSDADIAALNGQLHELDDQIGAAEAADQNAGPLRLAAAGAVQSAVKNIEAIRGAYAGQLHAAEATMMAKGYVPDALDDVDGVPGDAPADAARRYEQSGQRAADRRMIDQAKAAGKSDSVAVVGQPGGYTEEEAAAAQRLHDYDVINDKAINEPGRNAIDVHDRAQARRLAGERLDDYNMVHSTGPVARDPVLGGDARTRAQTRLDLQQKLEKGGLSWSAQPKTPDQATQMIDQMEASDRNQVLARLPEQLAEGGMSREGAAQFVEDLAHGKIPEEYIEAAGAGSKAFDGGKEGIKGFAEALPTGKHWAPGAAFSAEDVEALKKFGGRVGMVGSLVELGTGLYEWQHGEPAGEVLAKAGAGMAGAWALGEAGAIGGGALFGPPGAFAGALFLGTLGAFGGEAAGDKVFKWFAG